LLKEPIRFDPEVAIELGSGNGLAIHARHDGLAARRNDLPALCATRRPRPSEIDGGAEREHEPAARGDGLE